MRNNFSSRYKEYNVPLASNGKGTNPENLNFSWIVVP